MSTTIQLDVSMVYSLQVTCSDTLKRSIENKLMADFKKINQTWNTLCSSSDCSDVSITPSCVPESKQMMVGIKIKSLRFGMYNLIFFFTCIYKLFFFIWIFFYCLTVFSNEITRRSDGSEKYTPKDVLRVLIFEEEAFNAKVKQKRTVHGNWCWTNRGVWIDMNNSWIRAIQYIIPEISPHSWYKTFRLSHHSFETNILTILSSRGNKTGLHQNPYLMYYQIISS